MLQRKWLRIILSNAFTLFSLCQLSLASDVGVVGRTYSIIEVDFMEMVQQRLSQEQHSPSWQEKQKNAIRTISKHVLRPSPVAIGVTEVPRIFYYDPTIIVPDDIKNAEGHVIVKAGTRVNPLEYVHLYQTLLFFNADDVQQLCWAKRTEKRLDQAAKFILTQGNIRKASRGFQQAVYFDQFGWLVKKLGIEHVPAVVVEADRKLEIREEMPCANGE